MFFSSIFAGATTRRSDDDDDATTTTTRGGDATNRDDEDLIRPAAAQTPTTSSSPAADDDAEPPRCYFIVHNIAKKHNVGTIARCATAFGVRAVVLVGAKAYNTFGCKGASNHVDFLHYPSLHAAREGLTAPPHRVRKIMGVEIMDDAVAIDERPFEGSTAFIMGNEGDGLTDAQKAICDGFVYIRQVRYHGARRGEARPPTLSLVVRHDARFLSLSLFTFRPHNVPRQHTRSPVGRALTDQIKSRPSRRTRTTARRRHRESQRLRRRVDRDASLRAVGGVPRARTRGREVRRRGAKAEDGEEGGRRRRAGGSSREESRGGGETASHTFPFAC